MANGETTGFLEPLSLERHRSEVSSNDTPVVDELIDQSELAAVMNSGEVAEIQQTPGPFRRPRFLKKEDIPPPNIFVRPPFPQRAPDRSPVQGLTSTRMLLRTCFRISDALKHATEQPQTSGALPYNPSKPDTLIELYAMVRHSHRNGKTQFFTFADIFSPVWPPFLSGTWQGWSGHPSLDSEGRYFVQPGGSGGGVGFAPKMCRVVGAIVSGNESMPGMEKDMSSTPAEPVMLVYGIRAAGWSEIRYMKGLADDSTEGEE